ncbi:MAG TPA: hypothetical protein VGI43_14815 [Mucilaginibacter sp.]|jgi:hypothetical protein
MARDKANLEEQLKYFEKSKALKTALFSSIPIVLAIGFIYFTISKVRRLDFDIQNKDKEIVVLNNKKTVLKKYLDSIVKDSTTRRATFFSVNVLSCDTVWNKNDLIYSNYDKIPTSKLAYEKIIFLKSQNIPFYFIDVRYYPIKQEKDRILRSLALSGFFWVLIKEDNFESKIKANAIHYSRYIDENAIKVAALTLIRAGLDVKKIEPFSDKYSNFKRNSIEISSQNDQSIKNEKPISIDSILKFKKAIH